MVCWPKARIGQQHRVVAMAETGHETASGLAGNPGYRRKRGDTIGSG